MSSVRSIKRRQRSMSTLAGFKSMAITSKSSMPWLKQSAFWRTCDGLSAGFAAASIGPLRNKPPAKAEPCRSVGPLSHGEAAA